MTSEYISVLFHQSFDDEIITIHCSSDEIVSNVIERYRQQTGDYRTDLQFLFNGKNLNLYPFISVSEAGLHTGCPIIVDLRGQLIGRGCALPLNFTDVKNNKTKEIPFSKKAPSYRLVSKGINIFGICKCKKCDAYEEEVIVPIEKKKIDLIKERNKLFCPECGSLIDPQTVGFYLCKYRIYGKKVNDNNKRIEDFKIPIAEARNPNGFTYFDSDLNGKTMMFELIFEVIEYF